MMDFYNKTKPKARKDHVCEYCGQTIHKGEIYSYETGKYDGDMFVRKLCLVCENILKEYCEQEGYGEFDWEYISEWLSDGFCCDCEHGTKGKDDCEHYASNCPLIREKFAPKEDAENANPAN